MCDSRPLPFYPQCFVCGSENPKGLKCRFSVEGEKAKSGFMTESWMAGYEGIVHGGIIGSILDEALVWAAYAKTGRFGATAEIVIRFLNPLIIGVFCQVEGTLIEDKGKIWLAESRLIQDGFQIIAKANGKIVPLSEKIQEKFKEKLKNT